LPFLADCPHLTGRDLR